ncbi:MAG TPA: biotin--[acetyl-CoA-carboxylase] ligase [Phycisphaerae bacterium]|jgi:BirA family biotin operon repressor/biotin-[acetyl-CoA-carboxylase] ligase
MSIAWQIESLDEVDSTNTLASQRLLERWSHDQPAQGIVIAATRQSAGRGQHGRHWESPSGGLYMSAVAEEIPLAVRDRLALVAGVAVVDALQDATGRGIQFKIRWPNDVVVAPSSHKNPLGHDLKIAGILCEAVALGPRWAAIIGIGVNLSTPSFPPELQSIATSLALLGKNVAMESVRMAILGRLSQQLHDIQTQGLTPIIARVRQLDALRGCRIRFDPGDGPAIEGMVEGIDADGRLLLRHGDWEITAFSRGSVQAILHP